MKFRVIFEIDEKVEADDREEAVERAIGNVVGGQALVDELGNQNHIGRYFKGYVYYWAFDCQKGYPRRAKLKNWCDAWLYLKPCCLASEKEYRDTMGVVRPFEPCEYEEFNIID